MLSVKNTTFSLSMTTYVNATVIKPTTTSMNRNGAFVFNINQKQPQLKSQNIIEILMSVLCKPLL